jgi:hypothetical protein
MSRMIRVAVCLFLMSMVARPVFGGVAEDMALVKSRIIASQTDPAVNSSTVENLRSTLNADGTWPGINYGSRASTNWPLMPHLNNLRTLLARTPNPATRWQAMPGCWPTFS